MKNLIVSPAMAALAMISAVALVGSAQCTWLCLRGDKMSMDYWFTRHTGLACDMATSLLLLTLALASAGGILLLLTLRRLGSG